MPLQEAHVFQDDPRAVAQRHGFHRHTKHFKTMKITYKNLVFWHRLGHFIAMSMKSQEKHK